MRWPLVACLVSALAIAPSASAQGIREITPESEQALERGLAWLARHQGPEGNWKSNDLGLVSMGLLAYLSAGHMPGRGPYGENAERALNYILDNAQPTGLLNIADQRRDMYNHGLTTFVLGQAHGMTSHPQLGRKLDAALKLIANTQCHDGGWDYVAERQQRGHDLSLAVMQAKALRSAVDSGLEVPPEVVELAIRSVREHYRSESGRSGLDPRARQGPGQFTYTKGGGGGTVAMAACGVVCLQEFGEYDDWRIPKNLAVIREAVNRSHSADGNGRMPFDAYTLYYVGQALYQAGGDDWDHCYPILRDRLIRSQRRGGRDSSDEGSWDDNARVGGLPGRLYGTSVGCFILAIPNRYLPILQRAEVVSE